MITKTKTYDIASYEFAELWLDDHPHLRTTDRCCELAALIQETIEEYIAAENDNYEPKQFGDAWAGGFAKNH